MRPFTSLHPPRTTGRRARRAHARLRRRALLGAALVPCAGSWLARTPAAPAWGLAVGLPLVVGAGLVITAAPLHLLASVQVLVALAALNLALLALRLLDLRVAVRRIEEQNPANGAPGRRRRRECRDSSTAARRSTLAVVATLVLSHASVAVALEVTRTTLVEVFPIDSRPAAIRGVAEPPPEAPVPVPVPVLQPTDGFLDILIVGLDAGAGRSGARNDANMLVRVAPTTAHALVVGIPRNLVGLPMPSSRDACGCFPAPLYALYGHGHEHAARWPDELDPGAAAVRDSLEPLLGLTIEHYAVADMGAFVDLVDALGGVDVDVATAIVDDKSDPFDFGRRIHLDVAPGRHHLDGAEALTLARSRRGTDDYVRMERQRCLVTALAGPASRVGPVTILQLSRSVRGRLVSDISRDELPGLVSLLRRVLDSDTASLGLVPPEFTSGYEHGYPLADRAAVQAAVHRWSVQEEPSSVGSACG